LKRFQRILFVNQPLNVPDALERALQLARNNGAHLDIINVYEDLPDSLEKAIAALKKQQHDQVTRLVDESRLRIPSVKHLQRSGTPFIEIIKAVLEYSYDLVIKPARGYSRLSAMLFGSTDLHLLRKCPCPVWIIKPGTEESYGRILAAVDPDPSEPENAELNRLILELATSLALQEQSDLHIVHAWRMPYEAQLRGGRRYLPATELDRLVAQTQQIHEERLQALLAQHDVSAMRSKRHLVKGDPGEVIPALAREAQAQLIVMGTVARTGIPGFFIGNTAEKTLAAVDCSVLAVKPRSFQTPVQA
jgi:nucleotide-binding universal stress UspA family protein